MTISRRSVAILIVIATAISLGGYGSYLKRIDTAATETSQRHRTQTHQSESFTSESDAVHGGNLRPTSEFSPTSEETVQNRSAPVGNRSTGEPGNHGRTVGHPAPKGNASIVDLNLQALHRLDHHAYHDLLQFILGEEILETGQDIAAAELLEAAIREFVVARSVPTDVQSGVSNIQCTAALCTFLEDRHGPFGMMRRSPEWQAIERQGPMPVVWSVWLHTEERQGHGRVYLFRPGIEQHRDLLEAVVAGP